MTLPSRARGKWRLRAGRPSPSFHVLEPAQKFIHTEVTGGAVLFGFAIAALVLANSPLADFYVRFWETEVGVDLLGERIAGSLHYWVNDGLMTLFFFNVGLEIKRELVVGEFSNARRALVPAVAAFGGMLVPALIYLAVNVGGPGAPGWGVPMATDIAFSLGVLALLGDRVPNQVRVFLLALAIVDDIGAILVIAVFYAGSLDPAWLLGAAAIVGLTVVARLVGIRALTVYWVFGVVLWFALGASGIHATLAGVIFALLTPSSPDFDHDDFHSIGPTLVTRFQEAHADGRSDAAEAALGQIEELARRTESPLERLQRSMHPWSTFVILPLFALANSGVAISPEHLKVTATQPVFIGVALGLGIGKVLGIAGGTWLAKTVIGGTLPDTVTKHHILGIGFLAGIGFTVAIFISHLAFGDPALTEYAKLGILTASLVSGLVGYSILRRTRPTARKA